MAFNLQTKGFATLSFDINPEPVAALIKLGGVGARSAEEVARGSDVIFTMLPASPEVRSVVLGGVLPKSKPGTLIVDMSTIDPLITAARCVVRSRQRGAAALSGQGRRLNQLDAGMLSAGVPV
jgi:3-hydroxyisobutyrate dehydrogenase-like beta-hydroxyacid dehydrogenase